MTFRKNRKTTGLMFALTLAVTLGAQMAVSTAQAETTAPAPVDSDWWRARHQQLLELARSGAGKIDVLFMGDSITDGWHNEGARPWAETFAPLNAANFGIGGDKIENVLWRIENGEIDGLSPRLVIQLIGTNNLPSDSPAEIAAGHAALLAELEHRLPNAKILLLGVFPRVDNWSVSFRDNIPAVNTALASLADGKSAFFLNFGEDFKAADGTISNDILFDGLHLTETGYRIWTHAMLPTVQKLLTH